jgi:hypothetical protein
MDACGSLLALPVLVRSTIVYGPLNYILSDAKPKMCKHVVSPKLSGSGKLAKMSLASLSTVAR